MRTRLLIVAATLSMACGGSSLEPLPSGGIHVLFIGNSLTYANDLPATVAAIGASAGDTIRVAMAAEPDYALIDHLQGNSVALAQLKLGGWKYVVLQQGPTPAGVCRDSLVLWSRQFLPYIKAAGATPALMMTWPGSSYPYLFDEVRVSFEAASLAVSGVFLPAGEAWRAAWTADPALSLYGGDGYHPSATGSFLAALEIYERITGRDARLLPAQAFVGSSALALPVETIRRLQAAAHSANTTYGAGSAPSAEELSRPSKYVSTAPRC